MFSTHRFQFIVRLDCCSLFFFYVCVLLLIQISCAQSQIMHQYMSFYNNNTQNKHIWPESNKKKNHIIFMYKLYENDIKMCFIYFFIFFYFQFNNNVTFLLSFCVYISVCCSDFIRFENIGEHYERVEKYKTTTMKRNVFKYGHLSLSLNRRNVCDFT